MTFRPVRPAGGLRTPPGPLVAVGYILILLSACARPTPPPSDTPVPLAPAITLYDWEDDMPTSVLEAYTEAYGVEVLYQVYESQEDAIANLRAGQVYDVVVMDSRFVPLLIQESLLARLDFSHIPNSKNISANFRDLAYDPGSLHSLPYNWGTIGLVIRSDLVAEPVSRWADLWDARYSGRVGLWMSQPRDVLGLTLKSLGYSANSEAPAELEAALARLLELKPHVVALEEYDLSTSAGVLASGRAVIALGYGLDALAGLEQNPAIRYVLPQEGALLWNDTFIIPANSPNRRTAEAFLNFLLRADINAEIANQNLYATANEAALPLIAPDILHNPIVFPSTDDLAQAELILPLSAEGQQLHEAIWERFSAAP